MILTLILIVVVCLVVDFKSELNLVACDLSFRNAVRHTYERDDRLAHSWIDHLIISQSYTHLVSDVYTDRSGWIIFLYSFCFMFIVPRFMLFLLLSSSPVRPALLDWSKASPFDLVP